MEVNITPPVPPTNSNSIASENLASSFVDRINQQEKEFEKTLAEDEEYSLLVMLHDGSLIDVDTLGCQNPDMIIVEGVNEGNHNIRLLLHMYNVQMILVKFKKEPDTLPTENKIGYLQHIKKNK
jgi:hypothetical protein